MGRSLTAISLATVLLGGTVPGAADPQTPRVDASQIDRENLQRLQAEQQRVEREHLALRAAEFEEKRQLELEALAVVEHERERDQRAGSRRSAYILIGLGVALGGGAIYLGQRGKNEDEAILSGTAEFPEEILAHEKRGKIYNISAYSALGLAGLMFVIAVPTLLLNLDRGGYSVVPVSGESGTGAAVLGRF